MLNNWNLQFYLIFLTKTNNNTENNMVSLYYFKSSVFNNKIYITMSIYRFVYL